MSKLNPTLDELQEQHAERQRLMAEREAAWVRRHEDFVQRTTIIGGILLVLSARLAALGGHMGRLAYLLLPGAGARAAWIIASRGWGILLGMAIYGGIAGLAWLVCSSLGWGGACRPGCSRWAPTS